MTKMIVMKESKVKIGIIHTYLLIFIQIIFAMTFWIDSMAENYDDQKEIIYQIVYAYLYVSVLTLIKKLVIRNSVIVKYFSWIIPLEILRALSSILVATGFYSAAMLVSLFGLALLILYIILFVNILNNRYNQIIEIIRLRPFVIAMIFGIIIAIVGVFYAEYNQKYEIYGIMILLLVIPYVFIVRYLNKMKKEIIDG